MSLGNKKMAQIDHHSINRRVTHHHLLVHLHPKTKVNIVAKIHRTSMLDQPNPKVVWHKEVVEFMHAVDVVEPTRVNAVMARHFVSSVVKMVTL